MASTTVDDLILRARDASTRFENQARKPIVIEFAGCPKAGKTSTIGQVVAFFKRTGFKIEVVIERASVCPIRDKKHANFNVWTGCTTLANLLEKTQEPPSPDAPQILILDRGLFDSICWLQMMEQLVRLRPADRERIESFLLIDDWRKRLSGVILMLASPEDSMNREQGLLPVPTSSGSIMNQEVLAQMRKTIQAVAELHKDRFRLFTIDTSKAPYRNKQQKVCESIAEQILTLIEEHIAEEILFVPRQVIEDAFTNVSVLRGDAALQVVESFATQGHFQPRDDVEKNADVVQAIPVAIVRNQSGQVLRLRRKERNNENALHQKIVLWAGGHVRKEDSSNGETLKHALVRELHEELRLDVDTESLKLLGAVYTRATEKSLKHVAIVYEWRAKSDDVAVSLSSAEFFERRGTAVSGTFVSVKDIERDVENKSITEPWSTEIVRKLLAETAGKSEKELF